MKCLFVILFFIISTYIMGQTPYTRFDNQFRSLFDPIPIDKGQENEFFNRALSLFKHDTLKEAGQIFDRIYWLDTTSLLSKQALAYRIEIEQRVIKEVQGNLNSSWNWSWSGSNWGPTDVATPNKTKRLQLDGNTIRFYSNDSLIRQTKYTLTQTFNWVHGYLHYNVKYSDTKEEWYFGLSDPYFFTTDRLWIQQKSNIVCGNYGEWYLLDKQQPTCGLLPEQARMAGLINEK